MTVPRISILIPTRNRAAEVPAAIRSALAQDHPDVEVVVSDNASTDASPAVLATVRDPRLRCVRQERDLGMVGNWNACLALASGDLVLVLSDDDVLFPHAARTLAAAMADPGVVLAYGLVDIVDDHDVAPRRSPEGPAREPAADFVRGRLLRGGVREPYLCATAFRRADLTELGGFPEVGNLADLTVEVRLCAHRPGNVVCVPESLGRYRRHVGSLSVDPARAIQGFEAVREYLLHDPMVPEDAARHYALAATWGFLLWRTMRTSANRRQRLADVQRAFAAGLPWTRCAAAIGLIVIPRALLHGLRWAFRAARPRIPEGSQSGSTPGG